VTVDRMAQGSIVPREAAPRPIDPGVVIGHVHLRTSDIDRPRSFYVDLLGFDVVFEARDVPGWGTTGDILFVAAGGYHHHLGFNTWKSGGGPPQPDGVAGLHHVALRFSSRAALADVLLRLHEVNWPIRQATTARISRPTSPTPTATTWSCAGTGRRPSGRATTRATSRSPWTRRWTSRRCCATKSCSAPRRARSAWPCSRRRQSR
jgi:catechol-2,3-dioxygenase